MEFGTIDLILEEALRDCASEPIHIPGHIQPHGVLLGIDPGSFEVVLATANTADNLGRPPSELIGLPLSEVVGGAVMERIGRLAFAEDGGQTVSFLTTIERAGGDWLAHARVHRRASRIVLELEPADASGLGTIPEFSSWFNQMASSTDGARSVPEFCQVVAEEVRSLSGYDRVMVYRFFPDEHGEVIAESARAGLELYFGLHYPASDIPPQARDLFMKSRVRVLADTRAKAVPLLSGPGASEPLDMTYCQLRSFSPIHLEYLENMGVRASLVIAIIRRDRLWGLMVCHHETPRTPSHAVRAVCGFLSEMVSMQILAHDNLEEIRAHRASADIQQRLLATFGTNSDWIETILAGPEPFNTAFSSGGMAVVEGSVVHSSGAVPPDLTIVAIAGWIAETHPGPLFSTEAIGECHPAFAGIEAAAGLIAIEIGRAFPTYILWFRPEFLHQVSWGGDPTKRLIETEKGVRISPRKSFEAWTVTVKGRSIPWSGRDLAAAVEIRAAVIEVVLRASLLKRAEAEMKLVRVLKAVESSGEPILVTDEAGQPILVNRAFTSLFGLGLADLAAPTTTAPVADPEFDGLIRRETLEAGGSWRGDVEVNHSNGRRVPVSLRIDPVRNETGLIVGFITIHGDLTERRQAEREQFDHANRLEVARVELESAKSHAEAASLAKSGFLANMSHEIRTPMNGVIGMTELLLQSQLDDDQRQYACTIRASGEAMLVVINDILDLSKIEAGKMAMVPVDFDLEAIFREITDLLTPIATKKLLRITSHFPADLPRLLRGDVSRIRQILTNLAGNAVKFTEHGVVAITAQLIDRTATEVTLRIFVRDSGIGIPSSQHESVFESFNQGESGLDRRFGGTGLGLTISRRLAEMMGGRLDFTSELGRGSTFWVELTLPLSSPRPIPPVAPVSGPSAGAGPAIGLEPLRILVVEDNQINQAVAVGLLRRWKHHVESAFDGREAVEAASRQRFDLILMDVQMPVMDGLVASAAIRDQERLDGLRTPIVAMTAYAMEGDRDRCLAAGMDGYITKPVTTRSLADAIELWARPYHRVADSPGPDDVRAVEST